MGNGSLNISRPVMHCCRYNCTSGWLYCLLTDFMDLLRGSNETDTETTLPETVGFPDKHPGVSMKEHGWFLDTHKRVFSRVLTPNTKIIVELGSWFGSSAKWFHENTDATIFAIDIWDDSFILKDEHYVDSNSKLSNLLRAHPLYPTFLANLWECRDRLVPIRMKTVDGLKFLKSRGISPDVIYIDADHHYEPAKEDISAALELFPKAILVGDDYGNYEDVRRAVHECANKAGRTVHVDQNHCWAYMPIQSLTGVNIAPAMDEKKKGFKGMMSRYKKMRGSNSGSGDSNTINSLSPSVVTVNAITPAATKNSGVGQDIECQTEEATNSDKKRKLTEAETDSADEKNDSQKL